MIIFNKHIYECFTFQNIFNYIYNYKYYQEKDAEKENDVIK